MMKKHLLSLLLVFLTVFSLLPVTCAAAGKMTIKAGSVKASLQAGDTVKVPVSFADNPTYEYGYVVASWDKSALTLQSVEYTKLAPAQASAAPITDTGSYKVSFGDMMTYDPFKGDGTAFTLVFSIASGAKAGNYPIKLSEAEVYDFDINTIPAVAQSGSVTLSGSGASTDKSNNQTGQAGKSAQNNNNNQNGGNKTDDRAQQSANASRQQQTRDGKLTVDIGSVTGASKKGTEIKLPVSFSQNTGYAYGNMTFTWDQNAMELKNVEYNDKLAPAMGSVQKNDGRATVSVGTQNNTFTGTGTAFTLVFAVKDNAAEKSYAVKISKKEFYDSNISEINTSVVNGEVVLTKDGQSVQNGGDKGKAAGSCADGHRWDKGKVVKEPTCTDQGERRYTCQNNAEHTKTEAIPATGHKLVSVKDKDGKSCYECEICGKRFADSTARVQIGDAENGKSAGKKTDAAAQSDNQPAQGGSLIPLWITLMVLSAAGFVGAAVYGKRRAAGKEE